MFRFREFLGEEPKYTTLRNLRMIKIYNWDNFESENPNKYRNKITYNSLRAGRFTKAFSSMDVISLLLRSLKNTRQ